MSLQYDIPNAFKISPSITVNKPSDKIGTADVYDKKTANDVANLFEPLKLSVDSFKENMSGVMGGLQTAQATARKYTDFATNASIFSTGLNGAMKINPANLIQGLMKLDSRVSNSIKGFLSVPGIKGLGSLVGTSVMIGNVVQNIKNLKASGASAIFQLFNAVTGSNINSKILDKGPLAAAMALIFGESSKNRLLGMWSKFKKVDLYGSIGLNVTRSLAKTIIKYGDVDLLKDISEDAYGYALLEADSKLLYNFAAYYKLPAGASNEKINEIFIKFSTAANNLRPNWAYVTANGQEQIDGYFITYASTDFISMLGIYVKMNAVSKYDDEVIFTSPDTYQLQVSPVDYAMTAAVALYGLSMTPSLSKATTKSQIATTLGLVL